jgi:hypothetical protein
VPGVACSYPLGIISIMKRMVGLLRAFSLYRVQPSSTRPVALLYYLS